jgi:PAS domain S-box-containing protein
VDFVNLNLPVYSGIMRSIVLLSNNNEKSGFKELFSGETFRCEGFFSPGMVNELMDLYPDAAFFLDAGNTSQDDTGRLIELFDAKGRDLFLVTAGTAGHTQAVDIEPYRKALTQVKRHQIIQVVINEIAKANNRSEDLNGFLQLLKGSLSRIINTRNFFIALYDEKAKTFSLPVFVDDIDTFRSFPAGRTLTAYMIDRNRPLLLTEQEMISLEQQDVIDRVGSPCKQWLGVPLRKDDKVLGAIVLQSYTDEKAYDDTDLRTLQIVAEHISVAIDRKSTQERLKESERALKTLISNLPGIAYRCKPEPAWTMEFLSDGFSLLTGYDSDCFIDSKRQAYAELIYKEDRDKVWEVVSNSMLNKDMYQLIYRIKVNGGTLKWVWEKGQCVADEKGKIIALEGFIIDITDRIEMEEQLILAKERAEESDRLKSAFLSNLSHEIRSPMNSIVGFSQLLKSEQPGEPLSRYVDIISESSRQLLEVINNIVDMARLDSGLVTVSRKNFLPANLLHDLGDYTREQLQTAEGKKIIVDVVVADNQMGVSLFSDEKLIRKALVHIVNNAVKFTQDGKIEIGMEHQGEIDITFFVRDTGIGISEQGQKIIFDRFRQVDDQSTRKFEGTGLGLSISQGIARLLGGGIRVVSSEGKGAGFYLNICGK